MKLFIVILLLLLFAVPCKASDWSNTDTAIEVIYAAVHTANWMQMHSYYSSRNDISGYTKTVCKVADGGSCTNVSQVQYKSNKQAVLNTDIAYATGLIAHVTISYLLPKDYRPYWQAISIVGMGTAVGYNASVGVGFSFK